MKRNTSHCLNKPTHQVRHICKAHKADTQKLTLQKSLPCSYAQATLCGWTQTHIVDDRGEGRTYNRGFAKIRADRSYLQLFVRYCTSYPARHYLFSFLLLSSTSVFQSSSVPDGILIPVLRQALSVIYLKG